MEESTKKVNGGSVSDLGGFPIVPEVVLSILMGTGESASVAKEAHVNAASMNMMDKILFIVFVFLRFYNTVLLPRYSFVKFAKPSGSIAI